MSGGAGRFFEDFVLGQHMECPVPRRLGEGVTAAYIASCGDRTPRFCGGERFANSCPTKQGKRDAQGDVVMPLEVVVLLGWVE